MQSIDFYYFDMYVSEFLDFPSASKHLGFGGMWTQQDLPQRTGSEQVFGKLGFVTFKGFTIQMIEKTANCRGFQAFILLMEDLHYLGCIKPCK